MAVFGLHTLPVPIFDSAAASTMASSSAPEAAAAGLASIMSGDQLKALMAQEGPVVKAVVLEADGTAVEMSLDMSPKVNKVRQPADLRKMLDRPAHLNTPCTERVAPHRCL